jgi:PAS domain S-box-containing protein
VPSADEYLPFRAHVPPSSEHSVPAIMSVPLTVPARLGAEPRGAEGRDSDSPLGLLERLLENSTDIVCILDLEGRVRWRSPSAARLFGYPPGEIVGRSVLEQVHPAERDIAEELLGRAIDNPGVPHDGELRFRDARGSFHWLEVVGTSLPGDPLVGGVLVNARDITERKEAERAREAALALRNRFYARVTHELRTPMYAMSLNSELLLSGACGELTEAQGEAVERLQSSMAQLKILLDDILDISSIEAGKFTLTAETVVLPDLLADVSAGLFPLAERLGSSIALMVPPAIAPLSTDRRRLRQVISNLLTHAVRAGAGRPVEARVSALEGGTTRLEVTDRGPPIGDGQEQVFEEFLQVPGSPGSGSGLGLAIARRLAGILGGTLSLRRAAGEGNTFVLDLPARDT